MVRGAKVKTDSRYSGGIIERPLQKLFPLEMGRGEKENENAIDEEAEASTYQPDPSNMDNEANGPRYPLRSRKH